MRRLAPDTTVRRFVHGVSTSPADALMTWLERHVHDHRRLRLPVVLARGAVWFSLRDARIGGGPDALTILCDDSALGVGLAERARQACGDAPTCALWLEGYWRGGDERVFKVVKAGPPLAPAALATAVAEVEEPSGAGSGLAGP